MKRIFTICLLTFFNSICWAQQDGNLDTSFNVGGVFDPSAFALKTAVYSNNDLIVTGNMKINGVSHSVAKFNSSGALVSSYPLKDLVSSNGSIVGARDVFIQPDNKVILVGGFTKYDNISSFNNGNAIRGLIRINTDGTIDQTFAPDLSFLNLVSATTTIESNKILLDSGNNIYVTYPLPNPDVPSAKKVSVLKISSLGVIDASFKSNAPILEGNSWVYDMEFQSNGKILVGGIFKYFYNGSGDFYSNLLRINASGSLDTTFTFNHSTTTTNEYGLTYDGEIFQLEIFNDDSIFISGSFDSYDSNEVNYYAKLTSQGQFDNLYNANSDFGIYNQNFPYNIERRHEVAKIQPNQKILLIRRDESGYKAKIFRLDTQGNIDDSICFNSGLFENKAFISAITDLDLSSNNKIIATGSGFNTYNGVSRRNIVRLQGGNQAIVNAYDDLFSISNATTNSSVNTVLQANPTNQDTVNGNPATVSGFPNVVISPIAGSLNPIPAYGNITLNTNGTITVLAGTTGGTYTLKYRICSLGQCSVCSNIAVVTVIVSPFNIGIGPDHSVNSITLQNIDKKIIIGGFFKHYNNVERNNFARLNTDMSLDASFNIGSGFENSNGVTSGVYGTAMHTGTESACVNCVIAVGQFDKYNGYSLAGPIARVLPDGSFDSSFNLQLPNFYLSGGSNMPFIKSIALDSSGKIILVGNFVATTGSNVRVGIVRLNSNGSMDTTFELVNSANYALASVRMQGNNILILGTRDFFSSARETGVWRLLPLNGAIDSSFNFVNTLGAVYSMEVSPLDNSIVVVGGFLDYGASPSNFIVKLNSNGVVDNSFSLNSGSGFEQALNSNEASTISFLPDGSAFYVGGYFSKYNEQAIKSICRIFADGSLDTSFSPGFGPMGDGPEPEDKGPVVSSRLQSDGKLIIGGYFIKYNGVSRPYLTRLIPAINGAQGKVLEVNQNNSDFKIYPNPTTGVIQLDLGELSNEEFSLKIYNILGQQVFNKDILKTNQSQIDISTLESGSYFMVLSNENRAIKQTIIKK